MTGLMQSLKRAATAAAIVLAGAVMTDAEAQYWDGNHQVRSGFFLHGARSSYDVTGGAADEAMSHGGFGGGASGGLEWLRAGALTLGAEIDIAANTGRDTMLAPNPAIKAGTQFFASLRGRVGFHLRPEFVVYATGGLGVIGTELDGTAAGLAKVANIGTGGVYGGGFEFHRGSTIFFGEYLRGNFGAQNAVLGGTTYRYDTDIDRFRLGVKFKVGHDWHDEVRDHEAHQPLK